MRRGPNELLCTGCVGGRRQGGGGKKKGGKITIGTKNPISNQYTYEIFNGTSDSWKSIVSGKDRTIVKCTHRDDTSQTFYAKKIPRDKVVDSTPNSNRASTNNTSNGNQSGLQALQDYPTRIQPTIEFKDLVLGILSKKQYDFDQGELWSVWLC